MLHANEGSRQSRFRRLAELNPSMDLQPRTTVTYGKRNKPLLLRGTQFMRSDPYDLPLENRQHDTPVPQRRRPPTQLPDPEASPLSEGELEAVYGSTSDIAINASPVSCSPSGRANLERTTEPRPRRAGPSFRRRGNTTAKHENVPRDVDIVVRQAEPDPDTRLASKVAGNIRTYGGQARRVSFVSAEPKPDKEEVRPPPIQVRARRKIIQLDTVEPKVPRRKIATPTRRLPVDELFMVRTPPQQTDYLLDPKSSFAGFQAQDPIADDSSPAPGVNGESVSKERPLTSIRKRLKTPCFTHKSTSALNKKTCNQKTKSLKADRIGDGFDASELKSRPFRVKKQRKNGTSLLRGLGALQLQSGPLPEVIFEARCDELKPEPSNDEASVGDSGDVAQSSIPSDGLQDGKTDRRVTFRDALSDEVVRAQLSSVSAPKRVFEISSDESEEEEEDDDDDEAEEDDDSDAERRETLVGERDYDKPNGTLDESHRGSSSVRGSTPPSFQRARSADLEDDSARTPPVVKQSRNAGVTLDFRKSAAPGSTGQSFAGRKLMEVDEMIIDDPFVEERSKNFAPIDDIGRAHNLDLQLTGKELSTHHLRRRRSILRSSTPFQHGSNGTRPEDTVSNTRRNSNIAVESGYFQDTSAAPRGLGMADQQISHFDLGKRADGHLGTVSSGPYETATRRHNMAITLENVNASYFGMASNQLHHSRQEAESQQRRTNNRPDVAASHFFAQRRREAEIHVPGSSRAVPETSPDRKADYMTELGQSLNVVLRNEETMWTSSQSLPIAKPEKSLKSLTRSVSREYGTLSQAGRRRPSLPFQSPVKAFK